MVDNQSHVQVSGRSKGIIFALLSPLLYSITLPLDKLILGISGPGMLAGSLFLGSGVGMSVVYLLRQLFIGKSSISSRLSGSNWIWLGMYILIGGVLGVGSLIIGLNNISAASASLLLNLEGVFTALIAWIFFKDHFNWHVALGLIAITIGGILLFWNEGSNFKVSFGAVAVLVTCLSWAIGNNIASKLSSKDPFQIFLIKGYIAGSIMIYVASRTGEMVPTSPIFWLAAGATGFVAEGISPTCYVIALRYIGASRTGTYFSLSPFLSAFISILVFQEPITWNLILSSILMAIGVIICLSEGSH